MDNIDDVARAMETLQDVIFDVVPPLLLFKPCIVERQIHPLFRVGALFLFF